MTMDSQQIRGKGYQIPPVESILNEGHKSILCAFVKNKYEKLGNMFNDGLVAADATLENILPVFDNFIVTSDMVAYIRNILNIQVSQGNVCRKRHGRNPKVRIKKNEATGKLSVVGS